MSLFPPELVREAQALLVLARAQSVKIACAESCSGGLLCALLTSIPGSSYVFERGFVSYSNQAKTDMFCFPMALIDRHGAVSEEVARAMAEGALGSSQADLAVAITGIAGPEGGTKSKPVGLVHIGLAQRHGATTHHLFHFGLDSEKSDRSTIRLQCVASAVALLYAQLTE